MRRYEYCKIAVLLSLLLLSGSAACVRTGPVSAPAAETSAAPIRTPVSPDALPETPADTPAPADTPVPADTVISASAFAETYFIHPGDPPEVRVYDSEHGHWEYRADTLDVRIDCITADLGRGDVTYFVVHIHVRDGEAPRDVSASQGAEAPWRLARESKAVLLLSGSLSDLDAPDHALVADGEAVPGLAQARGRGIDARAALGLVSEGHYLAIVADGRQPGYSVGLTRQELADILVEHGAWTAASLCDGRETSLVFMGEQRNRHAGHYAGDDPSYQARVSGAIAFGESANVPSVADTVENDGNGR